MKQIFILSEPAGVINNPSDLFSRIKKFDIDHCQENFIIFLFDSSNKIIKSKVLFKGGLNSCLVDPKVIFRFALVNNANSIILAHNHPSGNLSPSEEDASVFATLKKVGDLLSMKVLDSVIFNKKEFYSMS